MTKQLTIKEQLTDTLKRLGTTYDATIAARDTVRVNLAALDDPGARRRLTDSYRAERKGQIRRDAHAAVGDAGRQAVALAAATVAGRDGVTGRNVLLRRARFVELLPLEKDGSDFYATNRYREEQNERRLFREELTRARWRADLPTYSSEELAELVHEAAATGQLALLNMLGREVRMRDRGNPGSMVSAQVALVSAESAITAPPDVQELNTLFDKIDRTARRLAEALDEIGTGATHDTAESVDRIRELEAEHGPVEAATRFGQERAAKRAERKQDAGRAAEAEVIAAITADESDAAAAVKRPTTATDDDDGDDDLPEPTHDDAA